MVWVWWSPSWDGWQPYNRAVLCRGFIVLVRHWLALIERNPRGVAQVSYEMFVGVRVLVDAIGLEFHVPLCVHLVPRIKVREFAVLLGNLIGQSLQLGEHFPWRFHLF
jgi:hypothetical protein